MKIWKWIKELFTMLFGDARPEEMKQEDLVGMLQQKFKLAEVKLRELYYKRNGVSELNEELRLLKQEFSFDKPVSQLVILYNKAKIFLAKVEAVSDSTGIKAKA